MEYNDSTATEVNKQPVAPLFLSHWLLIGWVSALTVLPVHADQFKQNNNISLELGGSWFNDIAPVGTNNAVWDAKVSVPANCTNTLGTAVTWGGIVISNPAAPVYINGNATLTVSNGI